MDCRLTIGESETFRGILTQCMEAGQRVDMILDDNGLTRAAGQIKSVYDENGQSLLEMEDGQRIEISSVVAVNGVFASAYSGC